VKIRLMFFAAAADRAGVRGKELDLPAGSRLDDL